MYPLTEPKSIESRASPPKSGGVSLPHGFEGFDRELSEPETLFLYYIEVVGVPVARAADLADIKSPHYLLKKPHMVAARQKFRDAMRGRTDFTRDDVVAGFKEAIDQAKVLADPMAQIAGWREIAKIKGYDKQPQVVLHAHGTVEQFKKELQHMSTETLLELAGSDVIDADFYRVQHEPAQQE